MDPMLKTCCTDAEMPGSGLPTPSSLRVPVNLSHRWIVIPSRQGSKGVPNKGLRPLGGKSIIERALDVADAIGGETIITTDYPQALLPTTHPYLYHARPAMLAQDTAPMNEVLSLLAHTYRWGTDDIIVLLQPTSLHPDRAALILAALFGPIPCVSVDRYPDRWHPYYSINPMRPFLPPPCRQGLPVRYRPNGLFYIMTGGMAKAGSMWLHKPVYVETPDTINIDTEADWQEAEAVYGNL